MERCGICAKQGRLMSPCECRFRYHERCMLLYVAGVVRRTMRARGEVDLTSIRCQNCTAQLHFQHRLSQKYSCSNCSRKCSDNCCNKYVTLMAVVLVVVVITLVVFIILEEELSKEENKQWMYVVIGGFVVEGITLLFTLAYFLHSYMVHKRLTLLRLLEIFDRNSHSNSSEDVISDDC